MDMSYFRQAAPISQDILSILIAAGWALLLGNAVFQAARSMMAGLGLEGEDPKLLFTRTFLFGFLLLASQQICDMGLSISGRVVHLLQIPDSFTLAVPAENAFPVGSAWLLAVIVGFVLMWQFVKLFFEIAERYVLTAVLVLAAPLAFAMGGSKSTEDIFKGWCRMFGSMCLMMVLNVVFLKLMLSAMGLMPAGAAVLPWMLFITGIARVARKADSIVARIGLAPAVTGEGLGRGLPGMVAFAVVKSIGSAVTRTAAHSAGNGRHTNGPSPNSRTRPPTPPPGSGGGGNGASAGRDGPSAGKGTGPSARTSADPAAGTSTGPAAGANGGPSTGAPPSGGPSSGQSAQPGRAHQHGSSSPKPGAGGKVRSAASGQPGPRPRPQKETRRSSVPPESAGGTQTPPGAPRPDAGTAGQSPKGPRHGTPSGTPQTQQGPAVRPQGTGSTRKTSVQRDAHTQTHTSTQTRASSRPVRQDGTMKITPPPGVANSRGPSAPGPRQAPNSGQPPVSGGARIGTAGTQASNSTQPPMSGGGPAAQTRRTAHAPQASASIEGMVTPGAAQARPVSKSNQPPVGGGTASPDTARTHRRSNTAQSPAGSGKTPPGTAGTQQVFHTGQPPTSGGKVLPSTAGTQPASSAGPPPTSGDKISPGTAGTRPASSASQPSVSGVKVPPGVAGTHHVSAPGQGTRRISPAGVRPPVKGAAGKPGQSKGKGRNHRG